MLKIRSLLLYAAIAVAMIGMTALAPTALTQQAQPAGSCPMGEEPIPGADKRPPTLDTNWAPISGTPVKPGDQIKVTMDARDDPDPRPSGIKTIQLVADSEDGRFIASENYEACSEPRERRVEATYTVPANPPPIVRLTALAEDHADLTDTDVGEFPTSVEGEPGDTGVGEDTDVGESRTGDWYGTLKSEFRFRAATGETITEKAHVDLTLHDEDGGNLAGVFAGTAVKEADTKGCTHTMIQPAKLKGTLVGSQTSGQDSMTLKVDKVEITQGTEDISCDDLGYIGHVPVLFSGSLAPYFLHDRVFSGLRATGTSGVFESTFEEAYGGVGTLRVIVNLQRAQN